MARFQYRMQNILSIKEKMESQAKNEYASANMALLNEKEQMNALLGRRTYYENRTRKCLQEDSLNLQAVKDTKIAIRSLDEMLRKQLEKVKKAEAELEKRRVTMTELMKERKTHETLKEQAFEEFMMEEKRSESKQIDELTSYVYGLKQTQN